MSAAVWINHQLFLGRVLIGRITDQQLHRTDRGNFTGFCFLPGAPSVIGDFATEPAAKDAVMRSAQSRIKAMFGAGIETTDAAVQEGRGLRVLARTIYRAGVWTCDRPIDAPRMFEDLRKMLRIKAEDAPKPATPGEASATQAAPLPEGDWQPIEEPEALRA